MFVFKISHRHSWNCWLSALLAVVTLTQCCFASDEDFLFAKRLMLDRGEYELAAGKFLSFVQKNPQDVRSPEALLRAAYCFAHLGQDAKAAVCYEQIIKNLPQTAPEMRQEALRFGGDIYLKLGELEKAQTFYQGILQEAPQNPLSEDARYWLAETVRRQALTNSGLRVQAAKLYCNYVDAVPNGKKAPAALYAAACLYYENADYTAASDEFFRLAQKYPDDSRASEAALLAAECRFHASDITTALQRYQQLLANNTATPDILADANSGLGWCHIKQNQPGSAAKAFQTAAATAKDPARIAQAEFDAASSLALTTDLYAAIKQMERVTNDPVLADQANLKIALWSLELGRQSKRNDSVETPGYFQTAVEKFTQLTKASDPSICKDSLAFLGETQLDLLNPNAASQAFKQLISRFPDYERIDWARYHLGLSLKNAGNYSAAVEACQELIKVSPDSRYQLHAVLCLAQAAEKSGNISLAEANYNWLAQSGQKWLAAVQFSSAEKSSLAPKAQEFAAESLFRCGEMALNTNPDVAEKNYKTLLQNYPDAPGTGLALLRLGELAEQKKNYAAAVSYYIQASDKKLDVESQQFQLYRLGVARVFAARAVIPVDSVVLQQAVADLHQFVTNYPQHELAGRALLYQGEAYYALKQPELAAPLYEQASKIIDKAELGDAALFGLAWSKRDLGDNQTASTVFKQLLTDFPQSDFRTEALWVLSSDQMASGNTEQALKGMQTLLADNQLDAATSINVQTDQALALEKLDKTDQAIKLLTQVASKYQEQPQVTRALLALARLQWDVLSNDVNTIQTLEDKWRLVGGELPEKLLTATDSKNIQQAALELAQYRQSCQAKFNQVSQSLQIIISKYPQDSRVDAAQYRLGEIALALGDWSEAIAYYKAALAKNNQSEIGERSYYRLGWCYLHSAGKASQAGNSELAKTSKLAALESFQALASKYPESALTAECWYRVGEIQRETGQFAAAEIAYKSAFSGSSEELLRAASYGLGRCYLDSGNPTTAFGIFSQFSQKYPAGDWSAEAALGAGDAALQLSAYGDSRDYYQKALDLGGNSETSAKARFGLGLASLQEGKFEDAREWFLKVELLHGQWPEVAALALVRGSQALQALGKLDNARRDLERVVERYPDTSAALQAKMMLGSAAR